MPIVVLPVSNSDLFFVECEYLFVLYILYMLCQCDRKKYDELFNTYYKTTSDHVCYCSMSISHQLSKTYVDCYWGSMSCETSLNEKKIWVSCVFSEDSSSIYYTMCCRDLVRSVANAAGVNQPNLMVEKGHKAGMDGLDEEKINRLVEEASKGSKFHAKKKADQARTSEQV